MGGGGGVGGWGIRLQKYEVRVNNYHINTVFPSRLRLLLLLLGWGGGVCVWGGVHCVSETARSGS